METTTNTSSTSIWFVINSIPLNDFASYESLLFTSKEIQDDNRWKKFIKYNEDGKPYGVYMPFANPQTVHEFALNHYVYWMVLYYTKTSNKFGLFFDYDTGEPMKEPELTCWACAYHKFIARSRRDNNAYYTCNYCPIWIGTKDFQCENKGELYKRWDEGELEKAKDIAKMEWHNFDDCLRKIEWYKKEYNKFILEWMISHGHTIEELIKLLTEYQEDFNDKESIQTIFNDWVFNQGFHGELWPCFEEWLETEYPMDY